MLLALLLYKQYLLSFEFLQVRLQLLHLLLLLLELLGLLLRVLVFEFETVDLLLELLLLRSVLLLYLASVGALGAFQVALLVRVKFYQLFLQRGDARVVLLLHSLQEVVLEFLLAVPKLREQSFFVLELSFKLLRSIQLRRRVVLVVVRPDALGIARLH